MATSPGLGVVAWLAALGVLAMVLWLVFRGGRPTHWIMELMHRVTGR